MVNSWPENLPANILDPSTGLTCVMSYFSSFFKYTKACYSEWICGEVPTNAEVLEAGHTQFIENYENARKLFE